MRTTLALVLIGALAIAACGKTETPGTAAKTGGLEVVDDAMLAAADLADGQKDHVVSKCAVCKLGMDGLAEHTSRHKGYEFRLCSAHCKETFDYDPDAVIRRLPRSTS